MGPSAGVDDFFGWWYTPPFPKQERQKAAFLAPPTMSPKLLLPSHAKGELERALGRGVRFFTSLMVSDHVTSAMPSPDSSMSHERIFPGRRRHFFGWWYT